MGAGMGTMLACAVISLTGAWFCCVRNPRLRLRRKEKTVFDAKILKTAFKIGVPVAVQEIAMNSAMVAATMLIAPLGSIAIAANSFAVTAALQEGRHQRVELGKRKHDGKHHKIERGILPDLLRTAEPPRQRMTDQKPDQAQNSRHNKRGRDAMPHNIPCLLVMISPDLMRYLNRKTGSTR